MQNHVKALVTRLEESRDLGPKSLVMEAARNDGYLLKHYCEKNIPVFGVEPAANIAKIVVDENNVPTDVEFFGPDFAKKFASQRGLVDVFHAHNVFAHTPDPVDFLSAVRTVLKLDGIAVIEAPYVLDLIENCEFDTIYHEHYSYLSATAVQNMAHRSGLVVTGIERTPLHGGSLLYSISHAGSHVADSVSEFVEHETTIGLGTVGFAKNFSNRVQALCQSLRTRLTALRQEGKTPAAYGASAKGSTLLNYIGDVSKEIKFAVDRSTLKQGRYMPGMGIPIRPVEALLEEQPDIAVLLSWNFEVEIVKQQQTYLDRGGCFLVPVPTLRRLQQFRPTSPVLT
jgi:SAM-dependent methyltransferase